MVGFGEIVIGWISSIWPNRNIALEKLTKNSEIATHRERVQRLMALEIANEANRYLKSVDWDGKDLKSKIGSYYIKEMEEADQALMNVARAEHLMFLAKSALFQAQKAKQMAQKRVAAASAAAREYRKTIPLKE